MHSWTYYRTGSSAYYRLTQYWLLECHAANMAKGNVFIMYQYMTDKELVWC